MQVVLPVATAKAESPWTSAAWLLGYAAESFALTFHAIRRDETSKFR